MTRQVLTGVVLGLALVALGVIWFQLVVLPAGDSSGAPPRASVPSDRPVAPGPEPGAGTESDRRDGPSAGAPLFGDPAPSRDRDEDRGEQATTSLPPLDQERVREIREGLAATSELAGIERSRRVAYLLAELREEIGDVEQGGMRLSEMEEQVRHSIDLQRLAGEVESIDDKTSPEGRAALAVLSQRIHQTLQDGPHAELHDELRRQRQDALPPGVGLDLPGMPGGGPVR